MKTIWKTFILLFSLIGALANGQNISVKSPDNNIMVTVSNSDYLTYTITYKGKSTANPSRLGFELKDELAMTGNFTIVDQSVKTFNET
jgi:hypothetical protein